ncbi:hypothetical protein [uncultured Gimesia sp.]|uniref:FmdB family zinc ribbon protein n=1 Tax=uncultured Gimesia sp. TaxID=1678688 RepID=UPI0030D90D12
MNSFLLSQTLVAEESYKRFTVRTWTYRDGTEATGKLITVSGPIATLRLEGQGTVRVPLEKLSVKDLNWLYEYHKRKKQLSFLPPQYRKPQTAVPESKPQPETPKPAETAPEKKQPEKSMPVKPVTVESYKPFTVREWTLKDGKQHRAKLLSLHKGKLVLQKEPLAILRLTLDQLSQKDLDWVIEYHHRNKMQAFLPNEYQGERAGNPSSGVPQVNLPPVIKMNNPIKPGQNPLEMAREKAKAQMKKHREEMREKAKEPAKDDDSKVVKANTEIDPALVAALRDFRVWTDKKGQKSEARLGSINGREIMFSTRGLGFARVHIGTLIEEDLQLLRDALKMHGRMDEIPLVYREDLDPNLSPTKLKQIIRVNNHRKWTDLSGNSVGASYVKMEDGKVILIITKTGTTQEFPYLNFSAEDQEYVQDRLKKEIPGNFFPAEAAAVDLSLTPAEREEEFRIWTDRSKRQIKGKFVRLAYGDSVAVINTGEKEELFITEFFSDGDLSLIKPRKQKQTDQLAMNGAGNQGISRPQSTLLKDMERLREMSQRNMNQANSNRQDQRRFRSSFPPPNNPSPPAGIGVPQWEYEFECNWCSHKFQAQTKNGAACPSCGTKNSDNIYVCTRCDKKFKSDVKAKKLRCPNCKAGFLGNSNFWAAIIKLVVVVILLASGGGYYRSRR